MTIYQQWRSAFLLLILAFAGLGSTKAVAQKFEKAAFFKAMASEDLEVINQELTVFADDDGSLKQGYQGALLMKKASKAGKPKDKLNFFKAGRIKLETALAAEPDNAELHFLRLIIQERAPGIVHYKADIERDKNIVLKNYKSLPLVVQHAVMDYSKASKVLHAEDLKPDDK